MRRLVVLVLLLLIPSIASAQVSHLTITKGATSVIIPISVREADWTAFASIAHNESGLTCYYFRSSAATPVQITLVAGTRGTYASGGWVAADNSTMPGTYLLGLPDAALATGSDTVTVNCKGVANMLGSEVQIQLINFNLQTATQNVNVTSNADKTGYSLGPSQSFNTSGSVGSVTAGVTVTTNNDKTGYRISGTKDTLDDLNDVSVADVWNAQLENWALAGSAGNYLDVVKHYVGNAWVLDTKNSRYSVKKDDGTTEYESGITKSTVRTPNR